MTFVKFIVEFAAMLETLIKIQSKILKLSFYMIPILFAFYNSNYLSAKVTCTGQTCDVLPAKYISEFDNIDATFQSNYVQPVMQSLIESAVISNNNSGMIGVGYVNRFQIGGGLGAGYVKKEDITVNYGDMKIPKLPNVGVSAVPTIMGAFNLGWILGKGPSLKPKKEKRYDEDGDIIEDENEDENEDKDTFLHRFNFYFHGMKMNYQLSEMKAAYGNKPELSGSVGLQSFGAMLRFQLMEPKISSYDLIGFSGISIGVGYNMQNLEMSINHEPKTNPTVSFGELKGAWIAKTEFEFASNVKSVPLELRTGIKILYFFDIYCGFGVSSNYGTANLHLSRGGPVKLSLDPAFIYNTTVLTSDFYKYYSNNALKPSNGTLNPDGTLSLDIRQKANIRTNTNYAIVGLEFNFLFLKLIGEATILEKAYGANVGLKIAF